jgi:hypothetical protein
MTFQPVLALATLLRRDAASPSVLPHGEAKGRGALEGAPSPDGAPRSLDFSAREPAR